MRLIGDKVGKEVNNNFISFCHNFRTEEDWDPQTDGLDPIVVKRHIPTVFIYLSLDEIDAKELGYQNSKTQTGMWLERPRVGEKRINNNQQQNNQHQNGKRNNSEAGGAASGGPGTSRNNNNNNNRRPPGAGNNNNRGGGGGGKRNNNNRNQGNKPQNQNNDKTGSNNSNAGNSSKNMKMDVPQQE